MFMVCLLGGCGSVSNVIILFSSQNFWLTNVEAMTNGWIDSISFGSFGIALNELCIGK